MSDDDLQQMSPEELIAEVKKLRDGIRTHRDSTGHDLCWHHPELWGLLPGTSDPQPAVPAWPEFLQGCIRYRKSLDEQAPNAPRIDEPYMRRTPPATWPTAPPPWMLVIVAYRKRRLATAHPLHPRPWTPSLAGATA